MFACSHDPEAGTLYWYFTELSEGQVSYELDYPAAVLLDRDGAVLGLRLDLDDEITLDQLELVLALPNAMLDMQTGYLRFSVNDALPADEVRLDELAILDLDDDGRILGVDTALPPIYRTDSALARLAPFMVEVEDVDSEVDEEFLDTDDLADEHADADQDASDGDADEGVLAEDIVVDVGTLAEEDDEDDDALATDDDLVEDEDDLVEDEDDLVEDEIVEAVAAAPRAVTPLLPQVDGAFRSGFVALVGKPNVGKSTLLNRLLGQKVSIVSPRPQTTRVPVRGILHRPEAQIVFIDTPGIHTPRHKLGAFMVEVARRTIPDADVVCFMVDISKPPSRLDAQIANEVRRARGSRLLLLNKVDVRVGGAGYLDAYRDLGTWDMEIAISARRGLGLETFVEEVIRRLPSGQPLYPADQVSDQSERQIAAELVREQVLYNTEQEVPHSVAVEVDEWEERDNAIYMRMTINVEKDSQKGIIIGAGGAMLKRIGSEARAQIERLVDRPVFLELWVKARPNWRDDSTSLGWLGYRSKDWR